MDTSFDGDGILTLGAGTGFTDAIVQPDGKIIATVTSTNGFVFKLNANGSFDTSFSEDGTVPLVGSLAAVALQSDGKIVATGAQASGTTNAIFTARLLNTSAPPTAADVSLSGRVTTASGQPLRNALVVVYGGSLTSPVMARTSPFGYYRIENLEAGETYIAEVSSKRYVFQARVVTLLDSLADLDFVAEPEQIRTVKPGGR